MKIQSKFLVPVLAFAMAGISFAASHFTLTEVTTVAGQKLKTGEYSISLKNDQAVLTNPDGKTITIPVKVEQAATKFSGTMATTKAGANGPELTEVALGGSTTRLIFGQ